MSHAKHGGTSRRGFLLGTGCGLAAAGVGAWYGRALYESWHGSAPMSSEARIPFTGKCQEVVNPAFALPGRYPGRVIEVHYPSSVVRGDIQADAVELMVERGMTQLTGAPAAIEAWQSLFQKGDRVGLKVNPVGKARRPGEVASISSFALIVAIVRGLEQAGVGRKDIILFERYADEFRDTGYDAFLQRELPEIEWYASAYRYHDLQTDLDGRDAVNGRRPGPDPHVAGYDPEKFVRLRYTSPAHNGNDPLSYESHLSKIITGGLINKFINLPVLKDHRSAGITMALKNMSHGMSNNVARSHNPEDGGNHCGTFIPAVVALEPIRKKAVLHIMDGLIGVYEGGPGSWNVPWLTWERKSVFFATDPVAMDHVGWDILDAQRAARGWASVGRMGRRGVNPASAAPIPLSGEQFERRQPEHVELAGRLALGLFDRGRIEYQRLTV